MVLELPGVKDMFKGEKAEVTQGRQYNISFFDKSTAFKKGESPQAVVVEEATAYNTTSTSYVEKKDWGTFTYEDIKSGITTSLKVYLSAKLKTHDSGGANICYAMIYEDDAPIAATEITHSGTTYNLITGSKANITATSGTFNLKTFMKRQDGTSGYMKDQTLYICQYLNESTLLDSDFGATEIYLKSITLPQDCTVKINDDVESILTNEEASDITIDYSSSPIKFTKIEILAGSPSFVFVEATE